jgi:hypothetical protein
MWTWWFILVSALVAGCTQMQAPTTDWKNVRPTGVPESAVFMGFSEPVGRLCELDLANSAYFEPKRGGTMYVVNTRNGLKIWSGHMGPKDELIFDAFDNSIRINGTYVFTRRIEDRSAFAFYFDKDR